MAKIQINGKKVSIENRASVFDILKKYKLNSTKVAIELNGIIVPRSLQKKKKVKK